MSNDDILLLVQELPLNILLTLKRYHPCSPNQIASPIENNNETISSGHETPNIADTKVKNN